MVLFEMFSTFGLLLILYFLCNWIIREDALTFFTVYFPPKQEQTDNLKNLRKKYLLTIKVVTPIFLVLRIVLIFGYSKYSEPLEFYIGYVVIMLLTFLIVQLIFIKKIRNLSKKEKW